MPVETSSLSRLRNTLLSKDVAQKLLELWEKWIDTGISSHDAIDFSAVNTFVPKSAFEDLVLSNLDRPFVITEDDLQELFVRHLLQGGDDLINCYQTFVDAAVATANVNRMSPPIDFFRTTRSVHLRWIIMRNWCYGNVMMSS